MENKYWIGRERSAMAMARGAVSSEARLIHYELAGRYSMKAAACAAAMLSGKRPAAGPERSVLHLPDPAMLRTDQEPGSHPGADARQAPARNMRDGR